MNKRIVGTWINAHDPSFGVRWQVSEADERLAVLGIDQQDQESLGVSDVRVIGDDLFFRSRTPSTGRIVDNQFSLRPDGALANIYTFQATEVWRLAGSGAIAPGAASRRWPPVVKETLFPKMLAGVGRAREQLAGTWENPYGDDLRTRYTVAVDALRCVQVTGVDVEDDEALQCVLLDLDDCSVTFGSRVPSTGRVGVHRLMPISKFECIMWMELTGTFLLARAN